MNFREKAVQIRDGITGKIKHISRAEHDIDLEALGTTTTPGLPYEVLDLTGYRCEESLLKLRQLASDLKTLSENASSFHDEVEQLIEELFNKGDKND